MLQLLACKGPVWSSQIILETKGCIFFFLPYFFCILNAYKSKMKRETYVVITA